MTKVTFTAAPGKHFSEDVNCMSVQTDSFTLYAEVIWPAGTEEDYGYHALKAAILKDAAALGIDPAELSFWYDGQEQYLSADASAACDVYTDSYKG